MILITNDDGIAAPGIRALIEVASAFDDILVVAPDSPQSGKGHAVTLNQPLKLRKVRLFEGIEAYECSGTPVDCVKLAKHVLAKDQPINLCLSGINHGSNASINIIYSGTMSAAMEASLEGIPSIGFSLLDFSFDANFEGAKVYVEKIIRQVLNIPMTDCKLLNVNIPACPAEDIQGIKVCRQAHGLWEEDFQIGTDPRGDHYYWLTGAFVCKEDADKADHDIWALDHNFVSVVPSGHDLTHYHYLNDFKYLENIKE